jgi:uncharacterized protein YlxW (UPF0749 family)
MTDDRVRFLEGEVRDLQVSNAALATSVEHLVKAVDALTLVVQTLRDTMNQGRGALWLMVAAAGAFGAVITTLAKKVLGLA